MIPAHGVERVMSTPSLRKCANIKSRAHPDTQCQYNASQGDFCSRHWKRPHRFVPLIESRNISERRVSVKETKACKRIQRFWRLYAPMRIYFMRGPAANYRDFAHNETEVSTMESIKDIPSLYFFSYADKSKNIWAFDLRSLSQIQSTGTPLSNPYTREPLDERYMNKFRKLSAWLRLRKYPLLYVNGETLTADQIWNQHVLDVFMKMESLGYLMGCTWFHSMRIQDHKLFYKYAFILWSNRLGLSSAEKEAIVPHHMKADSRLFRSAPDVLQQSNHALKWWQKNSLDLIQSFTTRSKDKTKQSLGALYVLMALVQVSEEAAEAYPWILETVT